jgi:hypothetical protein
MPDDDTKRHKRINALDQFVLSTALGRDLYKFLDSRYSLETDKIVEKVVDVV